jgi:hypothetical protein
MNSPCQTPGQDAGCKGLWSCRHCSNPQWQSSNFWHIMPRGTSLHATLFEDSTCTAGRLKKNDAMHG